MATLAELEAKYLVDGPAGSIHEIRRGPQSRVRSLIDGPAYFGAVAAAIDRCKDGRHAIYVTGLVHFAIPPPFSLDGHRALRDILVEKATAGVDVRLVFWVENYTLSTLAGVLDAPPVWVHRGMMLRTILAADDLRRHNPAAASEPPLRDRVLLDWSGPKLGAHHQKSVVIVAESADGSQERELTAFVGGMELADVIHGHPGHADGGWHDIAVEISGPVAVAVHENFRTRWAEAAAMPRDENVYVRMPTDFVVPTGQQLVPDGAPDVLPALSVQPPPASGPGADDTSVQIVQTFARYADWDDATLHDGRATLLDALRTALAAARRYVYIEDQYIGAGEGALSPRIVESTQLLVDVLTAGHARVILLGGHAATWDDIPDALKDPAFADRLAIWHLAGRKVEVTGPGQGIVRKPSITVHSKLVLIDDEFASIGSANFADRSMVVDNPWGTDTEIAAAIVSNASWVRDLRFALWKEHLAPTAVGPDETPELENLDMALGLWRTGWATATPVHLPTAQDLFSRIAADHEFDPSTPRVLLRYLGPGDAP